MSRQTVWLGGWIGAMGLLGCGGGGGTPPADAGTDTSSPATQDAATTADSGAQDVGGGGVAAINACTSDAYMDMSMGSDSDRMIMMNASHRFDMPCMTIAAGQSVMFMWSMATYPLAPGVAPSHASDPMGSASSPIQMRASGSVYSVAFPTAGLYPFYVTGQDANGLLGVIQVR